MGDGFFWVQDKGTVTFVGIGRAAEVLMEVLKFAQLQSHVDVSFWSEYAERKLNEYKLSEEQIKITGRVVAGCHLGSLNVASTLRLPKRQVVHLTRLPWPCMLQFAPCVM